MDTASLQFVLFGLGAALLANLSRARAWRNGVLALASGVLLALLAPGAAAILPLLGFLVLGYVLLAAAGRGSPHAKTLCIAIGVFAYVWLKKYTFLPDAMLLHSVYFTLGLSYIFFRVLHLVIDAGEGGQPRIRFGAYLLYTLNFTTLVSGPIQRYEEFARDQFAETPVALGARVAGAQLERIVRGFFKVNVLAMIFNMLRVDALEQAMQPLPAALRIFAALRLIVLYPLFLYCNFSGYIDIVMAIARLMRVRLPENFDRPFSAASFLDFWNRWHITLSTWLKNYVYNPLLLALMRRIERPSAQPWLGVFSFFVTFFLVGVWHGRTSAFVFFGILQGGGVAINKLWQIALTDRLGRKGYKALAANGVYTAFARGLTFTWFALTLFWFWSDWTQIGAIYRTFSLAQWAVVWGIAWLAATVVLALWERLRSALLGICVGGAPIFASRYARVVYAAAMGVAAFVIVFLLNQPAPDIVYKAF